MEITWTLIYIVASIFALGIGFFVIMKVRSYCKVTKQIWKLTLAVFAAPISIYFMFSLLYYLGWCDKIVADAVSFGFVAGIIIKIASKPTGTATVKLVAQEIGGKQTDVWLDSTEVPIGEVRNKIAEALGIAPANRVSIESGKGCLLEDLSKPLNTLLDDTLTTTDFFGFVTSTCYISVKEEEVKHKVTFGDDVQDRDRNDKKSPNPFSRLIPTKIKFGDQLFFSAKIARAENANAKAFFVSSVDKFAAAAPATIQSISHVRLYSWKSIINSNNVNGANTDVVSETAEVNSVGSSSYASRRGFFWRKKHKEDENSEITSGEGVGKPIYNGDTVVLECDGKFMSVTRGWWMAWSSTEPRRSGAFVIEIIEKAPQNKLKEITEKMKEGIDTIKEKMGRGSIYSKEVDNVLRPGDFFRLRSVKFPEYELGITSVKLRDKYCYIGLRKITDDANHNHDHHHNNSSNNSNNHNNNVDVEQQQWCMEVLFSLRPKLLGEDMFKMNS